MKSGVKFSIVLLALSVAPFAAAQGMPRDGQQAADPYGPQADYPITLGDRYRVDGQEHTPVDVMNYDAVGYAGLMNPPRGAMSSRGEPFVPEAIMAAHKTLPLPAYVEITALDTGRTILVRLVERGPMTNDRLIDLSPGAMAQLGNDGANPLAVRVRRVNPPEAERRLLRSGGQAPQRMDTPASLLTVLRRRLPGGDMMAAQPRDGLAVAQAGTPLPPTGTVAPGNAMPPMASVPRAAAPGPVTGTPPPAVRPMGRAPAGSQEIRMVSQPVVQPIPEASQQPAPRRARANAQASPPSPAEAETRAGRFIVEDRLGRPAAQATQATAAAEAPRQSTRNPGRSGFVVQLGAFSSRERADALAQQAGANVVQAGNIWRVRFGPYGTRSEAEASLARAQASGHSSAQILTNR